MDLSELREQIDSIDAEILRLFERRMDIVQNVAEYKRTNQLPVFQSGREQEIITRIGETAAPLYGQAAQVLFTAMMDISKCLQKDRLTSPQAFLENFCADSFDTFPSGRVLVACPGTDGSFSHIAAQQLFPEGTFHFYTDFPDVFRAVENGANLYSDKLNSLFNLFNSSTKEALINKLCLTGIESLLGL